MAGDRIANTDMDTPPLTPATLLLTLDILGTFVFAMSGAAAGVKNGSTCSVSACSPSLPPRQEG